MLEDLLNAWRGFNFLPDGVNPGGDDDSDNVETVDWEARYKGQVKATNRAITQRDKAQADLEALTEKYETQLAELESRLKSQVTDLEGRVKTLTGEKATFESQVQALTSEKESRTQRDAVSAELRAKTETGERKYPVALLELFEEGLLPGVETLKPEELPDFFTRFAARMGVVADKTASQKLSGAAPLPPAARQTAAATESDLLDQLMSLSPNQANYQKTYDAYLDAVSRRVNTGA